MSFLSNFDILVGILLGPTDLWESNEDMTFSISFLSVGLRSVFKKIWNMVMWKWKMKLCFTGNWRRIVVEIFEISIGLEIVVPSTVRVLWIPAVKCF